MVALVALLLATGCATGSRCVDLTPEEMQQAHVEPTGALPDNTFSVIVWSEYGARTGAVLESLRSTRPAKRLAEIAVLECAFLGWAAEQRAKLGH